jgi:hypothetical protein
MGELNAALMLSDCLFVQYGIEVLSCGGVKITVSYIGNGILIRETKRKPGRLIH